MKSEWEPEDDAQLLEAVNRFLSLFNQSNEKESLSHSSCMVSDVFFFF